MHRRAPLIALGLEALVLSAALLHAHVRRVRRSRDEPAIAAVSRLMPWADLSFAGGGRHLRFPSLEEPGAAFADAPASLDTDPAGGALAPPVDVYASQQPRERRQPALRPL